MNDLVMLNVELNRCKAHLRELQAELHFVLDAKPVDTLALGDVAKRTREVAARLEAVTCAILKGTSGPH
ncbi:hypothetical protein [Bradyrhizobium sp. RDM4]|uniref:hypothetical protein n=1 Tax=Bradyrhizobium sp. RDM4 TaxID=3378765 RepID=UPI0038FCECC9